jgi:uncharacterized protein
MDKKIAEFISKQTCGNLCCVAEQGYPYCFSFFYSFDEKEMMLYYKSSDDTNHSEILYQNKIVAGTILPDKLNFLAIKGIQFEGEVIEPNHPDAKNASSHYHKKHPMALAMPGDIWAICLNSIKFTDNTLGFGKKLKWKRGEIV